MGIEQLVTWRMLNEQQIKGILEQGVLLIRGNHFDERDEIIQQQIAPSSNIIEVTYDTGLVRVNIIDGPSFFKVDQQENTDPMITCDSISEFNKLTNQLIILDITSLASELIFLLLKSFKEHLIDNVVAIYVQPLDYIVKRDLNLIPNYMLSDTRSIISSIPGFLVLPNEQPSMLVVFLGFEGGRFNELREHVEADGDTEICPILPIPSYSAGWHMRTLYSNLGTLKESETIQRIRRVISWDPFHALKLLEKTYADFGVEYQINVAPIGTKPHTLATAIFAIKHEDIRIMYDHPNISIHRSEGVGAVRGYNLKGLIF